MKCMRLYELESLKISVQARLQEAACWGGQVQGGVQGMQALGAHLEHSNQALTTQVTHSLHPLPHNEPHVSGRSRHALEERMVP